MIFPKSRCFLIQSRLHLIDFSLDEILKIIRSFDVNKTYGHDDILIRKIKIFKKSLVRALTLLLERYFNSFTKYYTCLYKYYIILKYYHSPNPLIPILRKIYIKNII